MKKRANPVYHLKHKAKKIGEVIEISRLIHKNFFVTLARVLVAKWKYQATPSDYRLFRFDRLSEDEKKTFFTGGANARIIKKMNRRRYVADFTDKGRFNTKFGRYLGRQWLSTENLSFGSFSDFIKDKTVIIYKPLRKSSGEGVEKIELREGQIERIFADINQKGPGILEEIILQHPRMSELCEKSVNTLRFVTINDHGQCEVLYACLRMGTGRLVDNWHEGGLIAAVSDDGIVCTHGYDKHGAEFLRHPVTGQLIKGFAIPFWQEARSLIGVIFDQAKEVRYVGWDIAITPPGPIVVEGNAHYPSHELLELPYAGTRQGHKRLFEKYLSPSYRVPAFGLFLMTFVDSHLIGL